jgi:hypothetical protein
VGRVLGSIELDGTSGSDSRCACQQAFQEFIGYHSTRAGIENIVSVFLGYGSSFEMDKKGIDIMLRIFPWAGRQAL